MNTKKLLAILLALVMLATGAAVALSGAAATPVAAQGGYSFVLECGFEDGCDDCIKFVLTYYSAYLALLKEWHYSPFIAGETPQSFIDGLFDIALLPVLEHPRALATLNEQYMLPDAIALATEEFRTNMLIEHFYNTEIEALEAEVMQALRELIQDFGGIEGIALLAHQGDFAQAAAAWVTINDAVVEALVDNGVEVRQWLRSTPTVAPVCPEDPNADICLCDVVTTTTTTTTEDTTTTTTTGTTADTTTTTTTTGTTVDTTTTTTTTAGTTADTTTTTTTTGTTVDTTTTTTTTAGTTAEDATTTTTPSESTNWGNIAGIAGIVVLVIINLFAIFGFVRILFNM